MKRLTGRSWGASMFYRMEKKAAISVGMSRKSFWRLSKTYATQFGMTNKWLKEQGVISIKDLWVNIHYPATAR